MADYRVVGKPIPRADGGKKVSGEAVYVDDISFPGMLHGVVVRSPLPSARIVSIDTSEALRIPGVRGVVTHKEFPWLENIVRYCGQPVAAVAAVDGLTARRAADAIDIRYEELPAVHGITEAIREDAPDVRPSASARYRNVCAEHRHRRGDVEAGFARAEVIIENEYFVAAAHQGYMEPHCSIARRTKDGRLAVWSSIQGQFGARSELAHIFSIPLSDVEVHTAEIGGAFGGKTNLTVEPLAAALSGITGAPVKIRMTRRDELTASRPGPACRIRVRTGARRDGILTAEEAEIFYDTGAAPGAPSGNLDRNRGLYRIPAFSYDVYSIYTNSIVPGAYRAPGALEMTFAFESQMDIIAGEIGMDPIALRLLNAVDEGDETIAGKSYPVIGLRTTLEAAAQYARTIETAPGRGIGIACGKWMNAVGASAVTLSLNEDGTLHIVSGAVDLTGVNTALAQAAAEELGIPVESVTVVTRGTDTAPYAAVSGGSRTTYGMTLAVIDGVRNLEAEIRRFTASAFGCDPESVRIIEGIVEAAGKRHRLSQIASMAMGSAAGPLAAAGSASNDTWLTDSHIFITQIAEVSVDPDTGMITADRVSSFQDVGFAVNPVLVEGQIEGGIVQGFGWGMLESIDIHRGRVMSDGFVEYKIPTILDAPETVPIPIEVPSPSGPYGLKGVGSVLHRDIAVAGQQASVPGKVRLVREVENLRDGVERRVAQSARNVKDELDRSRWIETDRGNGHPDAIMPLLRCRPQAQALR